MDSDLETLFKEAYKCFNKNSYCSISFKDPNLSKICFFCLKHIKGLKPPDNLKVKFTNKKRGSEITKKVKKSPGKEVEIPESRIIRKSFRFPINIAEFPLKKGESLEKLSKYKVEQSRSIYGEYVSISPRQYRPMDLKVFLASLYFTNQYKSKIFENKFIEWIGLLDIQDSSYYRRRIIGGLKYLTYSVILHYHAWNYEKRKRETFKIGEDEDNLPDFSVFHILDAFHHLSEKGKRKSKLKLEFNEVFYKDLFNRYIVIEFEKVLPLSDISFNLYVFLKKQYEKNVFVNIPYSFEKLKEQIGITDKNITYSRRTFDNAFKDLKDRGLIKEYDYKIELVEGEEVIKFKFVRSLKP
ncbi:hypothetical protein ES703_93213 [subsurface metagenome]